MAFTLIVNEGKHPERSQANPSPTMIDQAIDHLRPEVNHYAILETEPPIDKCIYIQTLIERSGSHKGLYLVEIRFTFQNDFKQYRKHIRDASEVKRLFRMFSRGAVPNAAGWEDISRQFTAKTA